MPITLSAVVRKRKAKMNEGGPRDARASCLRPRPFQLLLSHGSRFLRRRLGTQSSAKLSGTCYCARLRRAGERSCRRALRAAWCMAGDAVLRSRRCVARAGDARERAREPEARTADPHLAEAAY